MGILRQLIDRIDPPPTRPEPVEARSMDLSWEAIAAASMDWAALKERTRRPVVTPALAENLSTAMACISAISGAISSFPVYIYRKDEKGREADNAHPVSRLVRDGANDHQSWPDFIEWFVGQTLGHGNGLAEIITDGRGAVVSLAPHSWTNVTPMILSSGRLAYDVIETYAGARSRTMARRLLDTEVIHLRDRSDDGLIGRSRLARCAAPLRTGLSQESYGEMIYENQASPSGLISFKEKLPEEEIARLRLLAQENWSGMRRAGRVAIVSGDASFSPLNISPESLEMLAARRFSTEEIARIYGVPPPIVGIWDHSTFTNSETAGRWFAQFCLAPWIRKIEEGFRRAVFSAASRVTHDIEFDMTGLLRGDVEARWRTHEIAVKNRILTANEVREVEGWNPRPDLDSPPPTDPARVAL